MPLPAFVSKQAQQLLPIVGVKQAVKFPKKNLFPLFTALALQDGATSSTDGQTMNYSTASTSQIFFINNYIINVDAGTQYRLTVNFTGSMAGRVRFGNKAGAFVAAIYAGTFGGEAVFTPTENTVTLSIDNDGSGAPVAGSGTISNVMLCKTSEDQTYEPYTLINKQTLR